jgi:hypothetical protein
LVEDHAQVRREASGNPLAVSSPADIVVGDVEADATAARGPAPAIEASPLSSTAMTPAARRAWWNVMALSFL